MNTPAPTTPPSRFDARRLLEVLGLAALYFLTARLGLLLAIPGGHVTPVWPPSGIALAAILLRGRRVWPGIWLGSFIANLWDFYGSPMSLVTELGTSAVFGAGASLTALLGSQLLQRFVGGRSPLERVRDVCAFLALGGVVSCLVSATLGVTTLCLAGFAPWSGFGQTWLTWWLGDTAGVFIVAPLLLVWGGVRLPKTPARWVELGACFGLLAAVTYYVFIENATVLFTGKPLPFVLIPFLVWSAVRFGQRGAAVAAGLIALLAMWGTIHHTGPFNVGPRNEALLLLELFLGVVALTGLCMAAMVTERERAEAAQQQAVDELEARVQERTAALTQSEAQARQHLAEAERARGALLSILEDERATEAALRASETRFRAIFEQAAVGVAQVAPDGRWLDVNQRLCAIVGYPREELLALTFQDITHPEDLELDLACVRQMLAGEIHTYTMEKRYLRKDRAVIWINLTVSLVHDPSGAPLHFISVVEDITARKEAEAALRASRAQLRALLARLQRAREDERIRVSRAIHDELGQLLTSLKMDVRWLERKLSESGLPAEFNPLLDRAVEASELADATIATVQKIAADLRSGTLDKLGLEAALTHEARRFQERGGLPCTVEVAESWPVLPPEITNELFYICQEALTNVARHAQAAAVEIHLMVEGDAVVLEVRDDGVGMAEAELHAPRSLGLIGMRERAMQCGGTIVFERNEPRGTRVRVRVRVTGDG